MLFSIVDLQIYVSMGYILHFCGVYFRLQNIPNLGKRKLTIYMVHNISCVPGTILKHLI